MSQSASLDLALHKKQGVALQTRATEILYGGAAGGGKSHLMRVAAIMWCSMIPGLQVYIFRRIREDLIKNHMEGQKGFRAMLAVWVLGGLVKIVEDEIRFWNGSKIYLCHCKDEKDRFKYQGAEIHVLLIDELTHFTDVIYRFLRGRVRAVGLPELPEQFRGMFPRILCGSNPGNIGHSWVKSAFVDLCRDGEIHDMPDEEGGMRRQFIPARLADNPSMAKDDPGYRARLRGLGSKALVAAMENGDWDIIDGAFFDCWESAKHIIRPFQIPGDWLVFRSFDWGSAKPFSVGWWAVVTDDYRHNGQVLPRGAMVRFREWYGCQPGKPDTGLKLTAEQVAAGIAERTQEKVRYSVADPAIFAEDGGPSIAERMGKAAGIWWKPADNKRVAGAGHIGGWDQMRDRMVGEDGVPMIYTFSTCADSIRTIPALQHDERRPEDLDTSAEDHCFAAGTLVETATGPVPIEQLPETGQVYSLGGLRAYRSARLVKRQAELVRVTFDDGRRVTCTPDHRFYTSPTTWVEAQHLAGVEVACVQTLSAGPSRNSWVFAITCAGAIFRTMAAGFIGRYGKHCAAIFRMVGTSIMWTATPPTTSPTTSSAFRPLITWAGSTAPRPQSVAGKTSKRPGPQLRSGMAAKRAGRGIRGNSSNTSARLWISGCLRRVTSAAAGIGFPLPESSKENTAVVRARRVRCASVERLSERADVYCITVPETGCFAIEGGLLVSNCADEWRYACMSRPWTRKPKNDSKPDKWARLSKRQNQGGRSWRVA